MSTGLQNERKYISVLICDIAGSYEFLYEQDPEYGKQILDEAISRMIKIVEENGGYVSQVQGDGLMVLYGAPEAMEDHAERACASAIALVDQFRKLNRTSAWPFAATIQPKIGISTGEAVVGSSMSSEGTKSPGIPEYIAVGAVSHLAGKLQKVAHPDEIIVSESTYSLVHSIAEFTLADNVSVHERIPDHPRPYVLRSIDTSRSRWEVRQSRLLSPFVGRATEMQSLTNTSTNVLSGTSHIVSIVGQAGLGKSRLIHEFLERSISPQFRKIAAYCERIDKNTPFKPVRTLILRWLGLTNDDNPDLRVMRLKQKLLELPRYEKKHLPGLLQVIDIDSEDPAWKNLEPNIRRESTFQSLLELLVQIAAQGPLAVIVEDAHWADESTCQLISHLDRANVDAPLFVVITHRDDDAQGPMFPGDLIKLSALAGSDTTRIAEANYSGNTLSVAELSMVLDRCGGIPLYIEEIARSLQLDHKQNWDSQLDKTIAIPDFLRVIIASRIDKLPLEVRDLLKTVSVLETQFTEHDAARLHSADHQAVGRWLNHLCDRNLLQMSTSSALYSFTHVLFREVTNASTLTIKSFHL